MKEVVLWSRSPSLKILVTISTLHCVWKYSSIASTKFPSFCTTAFWLQEQTDIRAYDFALSPYLWRKARLPNIKCAWGWKLFGINPAIISLGYFRLPPQCSWCLFSSRMLPGVRWQLVIDVSVYISVPSSRGMQSDRPCFTLEFGNRYVAPHCR